MSAVWSEPEPQLYRFSVKCDRTRAKQIERAAEAAGISVTAYVQGHFDTILEQPARIVEKPATMQSVGFQPPARADFDTAKSLGITVTMLRLYRAMAAVRDRQGNCQMAQTRLAEAAGIAPASVTGFCVRLERQKLIRSVKKAGHRTPAIWHVNNIGEDVAV